MTSWKSGKKLVRWHHRSVNYHNLRESDWRPTQMSGEVLASTAHTADEFKEHRWKYLEVIVGILYVFTVTYAIQWTDLDRTSDASSLLLSISYGLSGISKASSLPLIRAQWALRLGQGSLLIFLAQAKCHGYMRPQTRYRTQTFLHFFNSFLTVTLDHFDFAVKLLLQ